LDEFEPVFVGELQHVGKVELGRLLVALYHPDQILVLEHREGSVVGFDLGLAFEQAALEVEDALELLLVLDSERVLHQNDIHWDDSLHLNCVDSIDPAHETLLVPNNVSLVLLDHFEEGV